MNERREFHLIIALLGLTILWATLALWYHRLWLETLTERTDALIRATRFLCAAYESGEAESDRSQWAETSFEETSVEISWPTETSTVENPRSHTTDGT